MTNSLVTKKCKPCEGGVKPLTPDEYASFLRNEIHEWKDINKKMIEKSFTFKNFKTALGFINKVGDLAESEGHHPDILLHDWKHVKIMLTTHAIGGLSENDFILAAKIDEIRSISGVD